MSFWPGERAGTPVGDEERGIIEMYHDQGHSIRDIAELVGRSKNTVERVLNPSARERDHGAIYDARAKAAGDGDLRSPLGTGVDESQAAELRDALYDDNYLLLELGFDSIEEGLEWLEYATDEELAELA